LRRILITNDDSYVSPGLYLLKEAVEGLGEVMVFSTEYPRSVIGHTITFSRPLRIYEVEVQGSKVFVTDGTPVDVVHLARDVLGFEPSIVLSGVNVGDNLTLQHIFYSGTVAAAIEAALIGIPSIAFSACIQSFSDFDDERLRKVVRSVARSLTLAVLENGLPPGVDVLNVNIPPMDRFSNCIRITRAARLRWLSTYIERKDPRNRPYYWLAFKAVEPEPGSDTYAVDVEGCISITPLSIDLNVGKVPHRELETLVSRYVEGFEVKRLWL